MKNSLVFVILIFCVQIYTAQPGRQEARELVNAERVAFITRALSLSSEEAQKLWPIMNDAEQKKENLRRERNKLRKKFESQKGKMTDRESEEILSFESDFHQKEADLFNERQFRLKKIFTPSRILELYEAEEEFKKWLIKNVKNAK